MSVLSGKLDEKIKDAFIQLVRDDVIAQRKENSQAFFVDKEVYEKCYSSLEETVDHSSLSKFLLRYELPPLESPAVLKTLFHPNDSRAGKLATLRNIGGEYGYHLFYMALREDGKKKAVQQLEETARALGKKPPDSLFGHELSLQHPEPVNTLDATVHSSSSTKRVTEPLGEDVSIKQRYQQQDVSKSLDYAPQDLAHRHDCNCTGHGCFQRGLSIPDNSSLYKDPVISKQEVFSGESMGFDVPSSKTTLGTGEPGSRESTNTALCVDTETSQLSQSARGDNIMSSSAGAYQYQTVAHTTEPSIEPKNIPDTSDSHHVSQYQNN